MEQIPELVLMPLAERRRLADQCQTSVGHINNIAYGYRTCSPELAARIEANDSSVMRWNVRPDDWHLIWPELRTRPDAPPIPSSSTAPASTAVQTAQKEAA